MPNCARPVIFSGVSKRFIGLPMSFHSFGSLSDTVALDIPGDPNDGLVGEVIGFLPDPWYRIRWSTGFVVNAPDALLRDPPKGVIATMP